MSLLGGDPAGSHLVGNRASHAGRKQATMTTQVSKQWESPKGSSRSRGTQASKQAKEQEHVAAAEEEEEDRKRKGERAGEE